MNAPRLLLVLVASTAVFAAVPARALQVAGNGAYVITVEDDPFGPGCGTWTAQTGPLHAAGPFLNVLFGDGFPGTSDTSLRSWSSGETYRTGDASSCPSLCLLDEPAVSFVTVGGIRVGVRLEWDVVGADRFTFVQEVVVEGPVDGSENEENTVIRETHVVRNTGAGTLLHGLRKQWDWQVDFDDGPWFAGCDSPGTGCDRSLRMFADGGGAGVAPRAYVINADPAGAACPAGLVPNEPGGCSGAPVYLVAGTVGPPSALVPPPDEPELVEFNAWPSLVSTCWTASLTDFAPCDDTGDTAMAYFYGLTASSAAALGPAEERSYTQYVVAASGGCPAIITPPGGVVSCDAGGPYVSACAAAAIPLRATAATTAPGATLAFAWATTCAGSIHAADRADATLVLDAPCDAACEVTVTVTGGGGSASCVATVASSDTSAPALAAPDDLVVECSGGGPSEAEWVASATSADSCGPSRVEAGRIEELAGCGSTRAATWSFRAIDACGNATPAVRRTWRSADTTPPAVIANGWTGACAWSPRHDRSCLGDSAARIVALDACGETAVAWSGCVSDQPDEAPDPASPDDGDGRFTQDCVVTPADACLRVERAGSDPEGRRYALAITVTDACGNAITVPGDVLVPRDRRGGSAGPDDPCVRGNGVRR